MLKHFVHNLVEELKHNFYTIRGDWKLPMANDYILFHFLFSKELSTQITMAIDAMSAVQK